MVGGTRSFVSWVIFQNSLSIQRRNPPGPEEEEPEKRPSSRAPGAHLEVSAVLRGVLQRPERPHQVRQLLGDLALTVRAGRRLLRFRRRLRAAQPVLAQGQVLGEELGVAEALQRGVHEARVAVVAEPRHAGHRLGSAGGRSGRGGRRRARRRRRRGGRPGREAAAEAAAVRGGALGAEVRERGQRLEDAAHEAAHRARRRRRRGRGRSGAPSSAAASGAAAPEQPLAERALLLPARRHRRPGPGRRYLGHGGSCRRSSPRLSARTATPPRPPPHPAARASPGPGGFAPHTTSELSGESERESGGRGARVRALPPKGRLT